MKLLKKVIINNNTNKKILLLYIIFIILLNIKIKCVFAINYYVDPVKGQNTNDGLSIDKPFKTLDYAVSKLNSGDVLYLLNGTYYTNKIRLEFKNYNPNIIITSYPGHKPIIKSNIIKYEKPNNTWTKENDPNLNIWSSSLDSSTSEIIGQIKETRTSLLTYNSYNEFKDPKRPDGLYYDKSAKKLYIKFSDTSKDPNKISMLISNQENFELYDVNGLTIANLSMQGSTRCINIDASSNINIEGINCFGGFFGISVKTSKNIKITKNIVYMKRGNFAYNDMKNKPYETTGIYLQNNYDGIVVKNNEVYGHFNGILTYSTEKGKFLNA
ncbi:MAG: hypothetical protein QXE31_06080, partial [Candidatus Woesearchaeota archaeon]